MNIFSAFNGIGCGFQALHNLDIKIDKAYASEINPRANIINHKNWPKTIQYGNITKIKGSHFMSEIDLLMGGSPCQDLSIAGKMAGLKGLRSGLFYHFVRLRDELKPKYFFLENVRMRKESQDEITRLMGVDPIYFDSTLVSAQTRKRLYWTNIVSASDFIMPDDRGIILNDILEYGSECFVHEFRNGEHRYTPKTKANTICANYFKGIDNHQQRTCVKQVNPSKQSGGTQPYEQNRVYDVRGKGVAITANKAHVYNVGTMDKYRKLTPVEVERCFGLPDNYTAGVSDTARYHGLGNGWEVNTIMEFFKHLPR